LENKKTKDIKREIHTQQPNKRTKERGNERKKKSRKENVKQVK